MSKLVICAVRDSKVSAFMQPFVMRSRGEAIRAFTEIANDDKTAICRHPNDFALMYIGDFDDQSGLVSAVVPPTNLGLAVEFKQQRGEAPLFDGLRQ